MALCDASGNVVNTYEYDAFGAVRSSTGSTANAFTYTDETTDASTGLEYLRARYYDSATGAFISRDPVPGLNRYVYAEGNPIMNTDPAGLCVRAHDDDLANAGHSAAYRQAYEETVAHLDGVMGCMAGGSQGGKGLLCAGTTDCSQGHGCDPSVVNNSATNDHPDACSSWSPRPQPTLPPSIVLALLRGVNGQGVLLGSVQLYKAIGVMYACSMLPATRALAVEFPEFALAACSLTGLIEFTVNPETLLDRLAKAYEKGFARDYRWIKNWLGQ